MNRKILHITALMVIIAITASCKKEKEEPIPVQTDDERGRNILNTLMNQWYYWYDEMPQVTYTDYPDPYTLLEALRYRPNDRWSFVIDYQSFMDYYGGTFVGHGIRIGLDSDDKARIAMIYKNSPLYQEPNNVRRGWIVETVNGSDVGALLAAEDYTQYNTVMGAPEEGVENTFLFTRPDNTQLAVTSAKTTFQVNSVLTYDTLHLSAGVTGYLAFEAFIEPSFDELREAFSFFSTTGIEEMILDLRYNSGGQLDVAVELASYLAGNAHSGDLFIVSQHNSMKVGENDTIRLTTTDYPANLSRLFVITSPETASASENIINGLDPYLDVITIGTTTNGKPMGMYAFSDSPYNKFIFAPVTFKLVNADNFGEYFTGIAPDIEAADDITRDFGDREEASLLATINYLEVGKSTPKLLIPKRAVWVESMRPSWQRNLFMNKPPE